MAVNYQLPPWIKAPDLVGDYQRGLSLGQQAAQESQRLQMQQEENQRAHLMEQQRLQVDKAYKDQQLALDKQKVDQAAQLAALKVKDAAESLSARSAYIKHLESGGPGGTPGDPVQGLLRYGPSMDSGSFAGYAALIKDMDMSKYGAPPKSPVGKLQFDRARAAEKGDDEAVAQIDDAISKLTAAKGLTPSEQLHLQISAHGLMNRRLGERATDPAYQSRTNFAGRLLKQLEVGKQADAIPTVKTKEDYDALESGTVYIGKDGKKYKKP